MDRSYQCDFSSKMPSANTPADPWVACIIVTYMPDMSLLSRLVSQLLKSAASIYVVDNWFSDESRQSTKDLCALHSDRITFIPLKTNYGIAKAINIGIERARNDEYHFAMLFDQDSIPQDGLLEELQVVVKRLSGTPGKIAAIAPRLYDPRSNFFFKFALLKWGIWKKVGCHCGNGDLIPCEFINSSGSLIFLHHWDQIGPFREDFFIDHVETEWYMRVRYLGFKCYGYCSKNYLEHHMGDDVCRYWFLGWRFMPRRSPFRHYTIVRNGIWMWRMKHTPLSWIPNSLLKLAFTLFYFSLFDRERKDQLKHIVKGILHGLFTRPRSQEHV
jgi:rhamnosyltransferase